VRALRKFLEAGNKVKVICRFRGREIMHPAIAEHQLVLVMSKVEDLANVEQRPMMEARTMALLLAPKPQVLQRLATERAQRERTRGPEKGLTTDDSPDGGDQA